MEFRAVLISVFLFVLLTTVTAGTIGSRHFYSGIEQDNRRIVEEDVPIEIVLTDKAQSIFLDKLLEPRRPNTRASCIGAISMMAMCY